MKSIVIQYTDYNIELYSISCKFTFDLEKENNAIVLELDKTNVKHLNAIQYAFFLKDTEKCKLSISDIVIKPNNQHYDYSCYYSFSNKNLDFSTPKHLISSGNITENISTNDIFFVTLFIQNNYKFVNTSKSKEQESTKRKADYELNLEAKRRLFSTNLSVNLIDDIRHECGYILRGYETKDSPFYFEKYFKEYFETKDKSILQKYLDSGFLNVYSFVKRCPIRFDTTGVKSSVKGIRQSINNEYESAKCFPRGIYKIYKKDIHYCCKVTKWNKVDKEEVVKSLQQILDYNYNVTPVDGIKFEGIPCLVPYFKNNERKITWGLLTNIDKLVCNDETLYIITYNYVDDNIQNLKVFLQDIIIAKDIPFGMHYDKNDKIVYKFYDDLKRDKKILLPNLRLK